MVAPGVTLADMDFPFDAPLEVWLIRLPVALVIVGLVVVGLIQWSDRRYGRPNDALPPVTDSAWAEGGFRPVRESQVDRRRTLVVVALVVALVTALVALVALALLLAPLALWYFGDGPIV